MHTAIPSFTQSHGTPAQDRNMLCLQYRSHRYNCHYHPHHPASDRC